MRPDFLIAAETSDGAIAVDIVDPHSIHLTDALPKLLGLARYAAAHPKDFRRIEAVAEVGGRLRVLDLTRVEVRQAIAGASSAKNVYESAVAGDFG